MSIRKQQKSFVKKYKNGKCHDYRLFKESKVGIHLKIKVAVDTGYQGLQKMHAQTRLPKKKSKRHPLTKEDKDGNTALAKERVLVENVIGMLSDSKSLQTAIGIEEKDSDYVLIFWQVCKTMNLKFRFQKNSNVICNLKFTHFFFLHLL